MKKLFCGLLAVVFLAGCTPANPSNPAPNMPGSIQSALKPGDAITIKGENNEFSLHSVDFTDEDHGWVIRDKGYPGTGSQLMITQDGGLNWAAVGPDDQYLYEVRFADAHEGWALSRVEKGESGTGLEQYTVLHTADSGATWEIQWKSPQTSDFGLGLWFRDALNGYALVANTLLATHNGGKAWTPVSFGANDFIPQSMSFAGMDTGWVMGADGNKLIVLHTKDGGESWQRQFEKSYSDGPAGSIGIDFVDSDTGWFLTSNLATWDGELYYTEDGGSSWEVINHIKSTRPTPAGLHFTSREVGWIPLDVGAGPITGGLMYTRDGGKSFQVVGARPGADYADATQKVTSARDVDFISGQKGWAIGFGTYNRDYLLRTDDGGDSWTQVYPKLAPTRDISFVDGKTGFGLEALADFGALLATTDGGDSWKVIKSLAEDYRPQKLSFIDSRNGWILASPTLTNKTVVLYTSDGGETWTEMASLADYIEAAYFKFFDSKNGIAVSAGQDGTVYRTQDGGKTWASVPRKIPADGIDQFAFLSGTEGWEICNPGNYQTPYILGVSRTTDGASWQQPTEVEQGAWSYALTFLSNQKAMMVIEEPPFKQDSRMKLLVTVDGGKTWEPHLLPEGINGNTLIMMQNQLPMQFADDAHGWILTACGLLATQDGGKTWTWK